MQQTLPWVMASIALVLLAAAALLAWLARRRRQGQPLPTEWSLSPRPVFSTDERRVYRQLREALPHHIVLSKLPLVRFCQPSDPSEVRYWYELLGASHVTFAICSANGRVLAAVDLENERAHSRRVQQIKQAVLGACRVRYLRCPLDHLPSIPELQLLVPHSVAPSRGPNPAPTMTQARESLTSTVANRRRERTTLWQDSGFFQDSFFGADANPAELGSEFGALRSRSGDLGPPEFGGVVVDGVPQVRH
jgi:Protein of unknown function (DUF2726)